MSSGLSKSSGLSSQRGVSGHVGYSAFPGLAQNVSPSLAFNTATNTQYVPVIFTGI